jgi:hypothetical protein
MIITKLNLSDEIGQVSIDIKKDSKPVDVLGMIKYLEHSETEKPFYINWDKHLFGKSLKEVL